MHGGVIAIHARDLVPLTSCAKPKDGGIQDAACIFPGSTHGVGKTSLADRGFSPSAQIVGNLPDRGWLLPSRQCQSRLRPINQLQAAIIHLAGVLGRSAGSQLPRGLPLGCHSEKRVEEESGSRQAVSRTISYETLREAEGASGNALSDDRVVFRKLLRTCSHIVPRLETN